MRLVAPWPHKDLSPNARPHHMALARAKKAYRRTVWALALEAGAKGLTGPLSVRVIFCPKGRGPVPDLDNAVASFKAGQDGLADALGVNDRDLNGGITHLIGDRCKDGAVIVEVQARQVDNWKSVGILAADILAKSITKDAAE